MGRPADNGAGATTVAGLDLPETTAKEGELIAEGGKLEALAGTITGRGAMLGGFIDSGAREFSEIVHPQIAARGKASVAATEKGTSGCLYGAMVTEALAEDVTKFKDKLRDIVRRWEAAQADDFGVDGSGPEFRGMTGTERQDAMKGVIADKKAALKAELEAEGRKAKSELESQGKLRKSQLAAGPSAETLKQLGDTMNLGWAAFNLWNVPNAARKRAADLLKQADTRDLSVRERAELNKMLRAVAKDRDSAVWLLKSVGPKGYLEGYGAVLGDVDGDEKFAVEFQKNMGVILGLGTAAGVKVGPIAPGQARGPGVGRKWIDQFRSLVWKDLSVAGHDDGPRYGVKGAELIAPLLENGTYDRDFLVPVADEIYAKRDEYLKILTPAAGEKAVNPWNPANPSSFNPLDGALRGLGNNPDSAEGFFSGSPERLSRIDWVLEHAQPDSTPGFKSFDGAFNGMRDVDADAVGRALEAAATGHPAGEIGADDRVRHTQDNVDITKRIIEQVGADPTAFEGKGARGREMLDSFGNIAVDYREDIVRGYTEPDARKYLPGSNGVALDMDGLMGGNAEFSDRGDLTQFLQAAGHDPESHTKISAAFKIPAQQGAALALADNPDDPRAAMQDVFNGYSEAMSDVDDGKLEAIKEDTWKTPDVAAQKKFGLAVSVGAGFVPAGPPGISQAVQGTLGWSAGEFYNSVTTPTAEGAGKVTWEQQADVSEVMWANHNNEIRTMTQFALDHTKVDLEHGDGHYVEEVAEAQTRYYAGRLDPTLTPDGGHPGNRDNLDKMNFDDSWWRRFQTNFGW